MSQRCRRDCLLLTKTLNRRQRDSYPVSVLRALDVGRPSKRIRSAYRYGRESKDLTPRQIRGSIQVYRMLVYAQPRPYRRCHSVVRPISRPYSSTANSFRQSAPCQPPQSSNSHRHKYKLLPGTWVKRSFRIFFLIDEGIAKYILRTNTLITTTAVTATLMILKANAGPLHLSSGQMPPLLW